MTIGWKFWWKIKFLVYFFSCSFRIFVLILPINQLSTIKSRISYPFSRIFYANASHWPPLIKSKMFKVLQNNYCLKSLQTRLSRIKRTYTYIYVNSNRRKTSIRTLFFDLHFFFSVRCLWYCLIYIKKSIKKNVLILTIFFSVLSINQRNKWHRRQVKNKKMIDCVSH